MNAIYDESVSIYQEYVGHGLHGVGLAELRVHVEIDEDNLRLFQESRDLLVGERDFLELQTRSAPP